MATDRRHRSTARCGRACCTPGLAGSFMRFPHVAAGRRRAACRPAPGRRSTASRSTRRTSAAPAPTTGRAAIRDVSCQFLTYNAMFDFDVVDALSPGRLRRLRRHPRRPGADVRARPGRPRRRSSRAGALPVTLGGDHSVTIPAVRAVRAVHENPGLILSTPTSTPRPTSAASCSTTAARSRARSTPASTRRRSCWSASPAG